MFENLNSPKKSSLVFQQIIDRIQSGEFPAFSKLPNELELSRLLGVSRSVVREAMSALEIIDVVERRAGDGTYIKEFPVKQQDRNPPDESSLHKANTMIAFIKKIEKSGGSYAAFEARSFMEPWLAGIAAVRADKNDLQELKELCEKIKLSWEKRDRELFRQTDVRFHEFIAKACKNEYLESFLMQAVEAEKYLLWRKELDWPSWNRMEESVKEHLDIAEAIFRGDSDAACKAMELHFIFHWEHVAKDIVE